MKKIILFLILGIMNFYGYSQDTINSTQQLLQKIDNISCPQQTLYLKIVYLSFGKSNAYEMLNALNKKKFINKTEYKSSIEFHLINDSSVHYLPIKNVDEDTESQLTNRENKYATAVIKIKIYKNYLYNKGKLFFLIESIKVSL